ncbi:MAG: isocitrate lyase/phosphoenolpyruvate mutase family protein [Alphaproteobacteria bacterium]|nr:isocitrate lyase/phosphoenolpyruvate mutase family protein [Alphaproteobacteria bacterium]
MTTQQDKFQRFQALHAAEDIFVMPNPWNAGTARMLAAKGFEALATTSAGHAFSAGVLDTATMMTREEILANAAEIVCATDLPVSADLENGFGDDQDSCVTTLQRAIEIGLVGGSIEDASGDPDQPIYAFEHAVDRIVASCEATRGQPFVLTARAENHLHGRQDLADTIRRLQAFEEAGADVLYAPGLPDLDAIRSVCASLSKPVNVVMGMGVAGPKCFVADFQAAGVKRISVGGSFARAALGGFMRAALEVRDLGTFSYVDDALPGKEIISYMATKQDK